MKVTHIDITSSLFNQGKLFMPSEIPFYQYDKISLPLTTPDLSAPFILKAAEGLEMPELMGNLGNRHAHMNFGALTNREISLLIELNPYSSTGRSVSDLRDDFYRVVNSPGDASLTFSFMNGESFVGSITGHVSKLETALFTNRPEILLAISCEDPFIRGNAEGLEVLDANHLIAGRAGTTDFLIWDAKSTAPHGFKLVMECFGGATDFEMTTTYQDLSQTTFRIIHTFLDKDKLVINSIYGELDVYISRVEVSDYIPLGDKIVVGSKWPIIYPNYNLYTFPGPVIAPKWVVNSFSHRPTYWGV